MKTITISFNDRWLKEFLRNTECKLTDDVSDPLTYVFQKAVINLAENVDDIPCKFAELQGIRINPLGEKYPFEIPEEEFRLLGEVLIHSLPLLNTEKDKKRVRRLADDFFANDENGNRFFSLLLIVLALKNEPTPPISFNEAKINLSEFVKVHPFNKSVRNKHNNRSRDIKREIMRELKSRNSISKETRNILFPYIQKKYSEYMHLCDKQLFVHLLEDCQKKVDELSPNSEMNSQ